MQTILRRTAIGLILTFLVLSAATTQVHAQSDAQSDAQTGEQDVRLSEREILLLGLTAQPHREIVEDKYLSKCSTLAAADRRENPEVWQICAAQLAQIGDYEGAISFIDEARSLYVGTGDMAAIIRMDEIRAKLYYARFNAKWGG